jgi:hypothetical protein
MFLLGKNCLQKQLIPKGMLVFIMPFYGKSLGYRILEQRFKVGYLHNG